MADAWDNLVQRIRSHVGRDLARHRRARLSIATVAMFLRADGTLIGWKEPVSQPLESANLTWQEEIPWYCFQSRIVERVKDRLTNNQSNGLVEVRIELYVCEDGDLVDMREPEISRFEPSNIHWTHILPR